MKMMNIMGRSFSRRGVSVIIAALLLIAIAVAAAVLLYVFSIGLMGSLQGSGGQQTKDQLIMEAYQWPSSGTTLTLNLRNTGSSSVNVLTATIYVAGVLQSATPACTPPSTSSAVLPGGICTDVMTVTGVGTLTSGAAYVVKVSLADGAVFSYSAIYGASQ